MHLKNEQATRKQLVRETDERLRTICDKSGEAFFRVCVVLLGIAIVIAGYFSMIVFYTLLAVMAGEMLVSVGFRTYWKIKMR